MGEGIRERILDLVKEYSEPKKAVFEPGVTHVPYAGRVYDHNEVVAAVDNILDFWLTLGKAGDRFTTDLAKFLSVRCSVMTNSGSSANLLALTALTSPRIPAERRLGIGSEVITTAAGFPTTVAPIIQNNATAVFIDTCPVTGNVKVDRLESAYNPGVTKAVMLAHTLGNPFNLKVVTDFCNEHNLWLIEDNCDALGAQYTTAVNSTGTTGYTGAWGDMSTQSFYPPHHITTGEGGAVNVVKDPRLKLIVESLRDWGRDCWCPSGVDNTCNKRFNWQLGELPYGYDHKYIYTHLGYNLKPLDMQAAIGSAQLEKLEHFVGLRSRNWHYLRRELADLEDVFQFSLPTHATGWSRNEGFAWDDTGCIAMPSWFGFMLSVKPTAPFTRHAFAEFLNSRNIGNRGLFGGNLLRQPVMVELKKRSPGQIRIVGDLDGADTIMNDAIFIGVYPGLTEEMLQYVIQSIRSFVQSYQCV